MYEIVKELSLLMDHGKGSTAAMLEIGSHNTHGFKLEDGYHAWFDGIVQAFNPTSIKHEIIWEQRWDLPLWSHTSHHGWCNF